MLPKTPTGAQFGEREASYTTPIPRATPGQANIPRVHIGWSRPEGLVGGPSGVLVCGLRCTFQNQKAARWMPASSVLGAPLHGGGGGAGSQVQIRTPQKLVRGSSHGKHF